MAKTRGMNCVVAAPRGRGKAGSVPVILKPEHQALPGRRARISRHASSPPRRVESSLSSEPGPPHARGRLPHRHGPREVRETSSTTRSPTSRSSTSSPSCHLPRRYNHPKMLSPGFLEELTRGLTKARQQRIYTGRWRVRRRFTRLAVRRLTAATSSSSKGRAGEREPAQRRPSTGRSGRTSGRGTRREWGRRSTTSSRPSTAARLHPLPDDTADPRRRVLPKFDWPRVVNPKLIFPTTPESLEKTIAREQLAVRQIEQALVDHPRTTSPADHRADPGRGRRQPLPPRVLPDAPTLRRERHALPR